jgi:tetratricopeptide (TPR) repeat protein
MAVPLMSSLLLAAQQPADCWRQKKTGKVSEAAGCFTALSRSSNAWHRAEGLWGLGRYQDANDQFRAAVKQDEKNPELRVRWGHLMMGRGFNRAEAARLFGEALELKEDSSSALLGVALLAADNFDRKAVEMAEKALEIDPKLLEAQELLARLALEEGNEAKAAQEADKALAMSPEALDALAVRASIEWLNDRPGTEWLDRILKFNPMYGEAHALAAHFFVINRRYEEGISQYRKALAMNPELWEAQSELGVNLMRLGFEKEARELLEECYENGFRNAATVNTLTLMDSYKRYVVYKTPRTILRLHQKEAAVLRPYFERELLRAMETYDKKYELRLSEPVQLEVYPDHEDFAVRTMGLPGLGALGVTFGNIVAMDSPSARRPGTFHWASTLWHELSHVYVLAATRHRVPRWFTEGMAVHEETAVNPEWGDRLDPEAIRAIREKKLLPVARLDQGFVRPSYPSQVIISYFQAGRICDFIAQKWGAGKLIEMMNDFGRRKNTTEVVTAQLGMKPEAFDKEFLAWLEKETERPVKGFDEWQKQLKAVAAGAREKRWDDVLKLGAPLKEVYPDYVVAGNVYEFLVQAFESKGDKSSAQQELQAWMRAGGRYPATLKKLATMQEESGQKKEAALTLARINYIYPVQDEELHRRLGDLLLEQGDHAGASLEFQALVALKPLDAAAAYFKLASACKAAGRTQAARDALLEALEAAPGYRPAQKMLLELTSK